MFTERQGQAIFNEYPENLPPVPHITFIALQCQWWQHTTRSCKMFQYDIILFCNCCQIHFFIDRTTVPTHAINCVVICSVNVIPIFSQLCCNAVFFHSCHALPIPQYFPCSQIVWFPAIIQKKKAVLFVLLMPMLYTFFAFLFCKETIRFIIYQIFFHFFNICLYIYQINTFLLFQVVPSVLPVKMLLPPPKQYKCDF